MRNMILSVLLCVWLIADIILAINVRSMKDRIRAQEELNGMLPMRDYQLDVDNDTFKLYDGDVLKRKWVDTTLAKLIDNQ